MSKKPWQMEFVLLFCGAQFLCYSTAILAVNVLHHFHVNGFKNEGDFGIILFATLGLQGATWILIPIFLRLHRVGWQEAFGFQNKNLCVWGWTVGVLIVALPVALFLEFLSAVAMDKIGWEAKPEEAVKLLTNAPLWPTGIYLGFFAVVMAPVAEEFIFRGVLFPFTKQLGYPKIAWLGVSLVFALIHGSPVDFIPLFFLALALTWLYEKTDNLLAPIAAHSLFNATNLLMLYLASEFGRSLPSQ